ncbi:hypothetical protein [Leptospira santarosai]|uniref:hypothetical protein n=1 Tax=Leptospira santarosai TaxID=28183 RepID=UPI0002FD869A|nr:hypothetical protein [Leptospira santarosai]
MKQQYKLGTVIAERELSLKVGRKKQTVLIRIGKPKISNDPKMDWYCPFQISKIGLERVSKLLVLLNCNYLLVKWTKIIQRYRTSFGKK